MNEERWLYAWGLGSIAAGGASLLVPLYVVELGGGPAALGLLSAAAALAGALGALVWGRLADRTGRWRRLGVGSLAGIVVALASVPLVAGVPRVVLANGLLWLSFSAATPVFTMLTVRDAAAGDRSRRLAQLNRVQGYGWAGGLALGAVWTTVVDRLFALAPLASQRAFLGLCALVGTVGVLVGARWLPAGARPPSRAGRRWVSEWQPTVTATFPFLPGQVYRQVRGLRPRRFVDRFTPTLAGYFVAVVLFFAGFGVFFAPLPAYLASVGYPSGLIFLLFLLSSLGSATFYRTAGELTVRYDRRLLQAGALGVRGSALPAVALVGTGLVPGLGGLVMGVLFVVLGAGWAVIALTATDFISDAAPAGIRGEALGVYTALSALAGGVGSLAGGSLAEWVGYVPTFGLAGAVVLLSAVVVLRPGTVAALARVTRLSTGQSV